MCITNFQKLQEHEKVENLNTYEAERSMHDQTFMETQILISMLAATVACVDLGLYGGLKPQTMI